MRDSIALVSAALVILPRYSLLHTAEAHGLRLNQRIESFTSEYTMSQLFTDEVFEKRETKEEPLEKGEYENCVFKHCDFSNADLAEIAFVECQFTDCNLSLAGLAKTAFRDVAFKDCKMLGLHFWNCNDFGIAFSFERCLLNHSSFYRMKLKGTAFSNTQLRDVDFTECDLTSAVFDECDLANATFERTIIEKADFRTAFNYSIDPESNKVKKARFSTAGLAGLLDKYDINIER